jgi:hypothetical protein
MSAALRGYIHAFDLNAVCQYSDGRIAVSGNPAGAIAAYWCEGRRDAGFVAKLATEGRMSIPDAAQQLHVRVAPHAHVAAIGEDPENTSLGRRQSPEASLRGHSLRDIRSILDQHRDPGLAASAIRKLENANKMG